MTNSTDILIIILNFFNLSPSMAFIFSSYKYGVRVNISSITPEIYIFLPNVKLINHPVSLLHDDL